MEAAKCFLGECLDFSQRNLNQLNKLWEDGKSGVSSLRRGRSFQRYSDTAAAWAPFQFHPLLMKVTREIPCSGFESAYFAENIEPTELKMTISGTARTAHIADSTLTFGTGLSRSV